MQISWHSMTTPPIKNYILRRFAPYVITFAISALFISFATREIGFFDQGIAVEGGDLLAFQAQFQVAGQAGPWGTSDNLFWPIGSNNWSGPQAGMSMLFQAYFFQTLFHFSSMGAYKAIFIVAAALSAVSVLYFLRSIEKNKFIWLQIAMSVSLGAGAFVILKLSHINVASFYLIPLIFASLIRVASKERFREKFVDLLIPFLGGLLAPTWWVAVSFFIVVLMLGFSLFESRKTLGNTILIFSSLAAGFLFPFILIVINNPASSKPTRSVWDSNFYGGHLTDFFLGSPFATNLFPSLKAFEGGSSPELSHPGLVGAALCFIALLSIFSLSGHSEIDKTPRRTIYGLTVSVFMLFLAGGIGNLQAGLAASIGIISPARVWARLIIAIAVLGAAWLLIGLTRENSFSQRLKKVFPSAALVLVIFMASTLDLRASGLDGKFAPSPSFPESIAVEFIRNNKEACPVAQLPVDSSPMSDAYDPSRISELLYRGYIPYLIAPEYKWSFGDAFAEKTTPTVRLPKNVGESEVALLSAKKYCAILFDKFLAQSILDRGVELPGSTISEAIKPVFESERYSVYWTETEVPIQPK